MDFFPTLDTTQSRKRTSAGKTAITGRKEKVSYTLISFCSSVPSYLFTLKMKVERKFWCCICEEVKDKHLVSKKLRVNVPSGKITMLTFQTLALHSDNVCFIIFVMWNLTLIIK